MSEHPSMLITVPVVCANCGETAMVNAANALLHGWPRHCGRTMVDARDGVNVFRVHDASNAKADAA